VTVPYVEQQPPAPGAFLPDARAAWAAAETGQGVQSGFVVAVTNRTAGVFGYRQARGLERARADPGWLPAQRCLPRHQHRPARHRWYHVSSRRISPHRGSSHQGRAPGGAGWAR